MKNLLKLILNDLRYIGRKKIISIVLISFLIFAPFMALINGQTPELPAHNYYVVEDITPYDLSNLSLNIDSMNYAYGSMNFKGFILDQHLQPLRNKTVAMEINCSSINEVKHFKTNSQGFFSVNLTGVTNFNPFNLFGFYQGENPIKFHVTDVTGSQSDTIHTEIKSPSQSPSLNTSSIIPGKYRLPYGSGTLSMTMLPYYNLGLYGQVPVFYNAGSKPVNITVSAVSIINPNDVKNTTPFKVEIMPGELTEPFSYNEVLSFNQYGNIKVEINGLDYGLYAVPGAGNNNVPSFFVSPLPVFAYILGLIGVSSVVLTVVSSIYNLPEREIYLSLPLKRRNLIFSRIVAGLSVSLFATAFGIFIDDGLGFIFYHNYIGLYPSITGLLDVLALFLLSVPIFLFLESKKNVSSGFRTLLLLFFTFILPIILSFMIFVLDGKILGSFYIMPPHNSLIQPFASRVAEINLILSAIPFSSPIVLMEYFSYSPFAFVPGSGFFVPMYNHRSLLLMSPLIIYPVLFIWFGIITFFSIRRYERN